MKPQPLCALPTRPAFPTRLWMVGALVWGTAMAFSAWAGLFLRFRLETSNLSELLFLYFSGGLVAWIVALPLARPFMRHRLIERRFAAMFLALTVATVLVTAGFFALDYRSFYAQWHAPFGTRIWAFQFVFTSASAAYQFLVLGLRLYLPFGFILLVCASFYLAKRMH